MHPVMLLAFPHRIADKQVAIEVDGVGEHPGDTEVSAREPVDELRQDGCTQTLMGEGRQGVCSLLTTTRNNPEDAPLRPGCHGITLYSTAHRPT